MRPLPERSSSGNKLTPCLKPAWKFQASHAIDALSTLGLISTRLGADIDVAPEVKQATIGLREVEALRRVLGVDEGQLARVAKRNTHGAVLVPRALRVERGRVVVERLPVARVVVPVEARAATLRLEAEEVAHLFLDLRDTNRR